MGLGPGDSAADQVAAMEETAMKAAKKRGFTIVELLVVITIIGILMAMLFPALNTARNAARLAQCTNRQRSLGQGMQNYALKRDLYPGWKNEIRPESGDSFDANWVVRILPSIEQSNLYDKIRATQAILTNDPASASVDNRLPRLDSLICPANPPIAKFDPVLSYVVNCGVAGDNSGDRDKGIFFNRGKGVTDPVKMRPSFVSGADGTTNTLLMSENLHTKQWNNRDNNLSEAAVGLMWSQTGTATLGSLRDSDDDKNHLVPSSNHSGVIVMTFCDGHTKSVSENITREVYKRMMTPDGGEMLSNDMLEP
jgi:prepilin-type N-terminal cleavage/methylation domain-containing protein